MNYIEMITGPGTAESIAKAQPRLKQMRGAQPSITTNYTTGRCLQHRTGLQALGSGQEPTYIYNQPPRGNSSCGVSGKDSQVSRRPHSKGVGRLNHGPAASPGRGRSDAKT